MLPLELDQYPRGRLPGYKGFNPQAIPNVTSVVPASGPATTTTQGVANNYTTGRLPEAIDRSYFINANKGLMSFYTPGAGLVVSDNGKAQA